MIDSNGDRLQSTLEPSSVQVATKGPWSLNKGPKEIQKNSKEALEVPILL